MSLRRGPFGTKVNGSIFNGMIHDPGGVVIVFNGDKHNLATALLETLAFLKGKFAEIVMPPVPAFRW